MRTRTWLLYIVLAVLVPAFLVSALGIFYLYSEEQIAFRKSMQETARALASLLDKEITSREALLHTLALSPAIDNGDLPAFQRHARAIATTQETNIFLTDLEGQELMNTRTPEGSADLPKSKGLMALRAESGPDATVVSNVFMAPVGHAYSVAVQVPIKRNGVALYYLNSGTFVSRFQSIFTGQNLPAEWVGTIVDRNGIVAARSMDPEHLVGKPISQRLAALATTEAEGRYDGPSLEGVNMTAFFSRAPLSGWTFIVSVPKSIIRASAIHAIMLLSCIWLAFAALAMLGALYLAHRTSKPIEALRSAAGRLGRGEAVPEFRSGIVEIDAVAREMRHASERLLDSKAELEIQVAEAVSATARSQRALLQAQKLEALGRLTGGIAHDFNNVLQALNTGLHVVRLSAQEGRAANALEACQRAIKRATELTGQLAVFGRTQDSRLEVCALEHQLKIVRPLLDSAIRSDIELLIQVDAGLWPVKIDTLQFELAVLNIVINARDAMPAGGRLDIAASNVTIREDRPDLRAGDYVQLTISDSGSGMDSEVLTMALEPFFSTKAVGKGSGMGLPQAYGFARQAGGVLTLESKPHIGTCVTIYMARTLESPRPGADADVERSATRSGGSVLFVEDDVLVREVVEPALANAGFKVETAASGDEAYRTLQSGRHFDVMFSDVVMPGTLSGIDLAELAARQFPEMQVVLASGYSDRLAASKGVRILPKPYDMSVLIATLNGTGADIAKRVD
ncbi:hybrid sensor histidine kinase/response regulator [Oxalobacteraceae bacterium CAVE-383]|nr:hybrid sensor histidine kinase/response regulator [Oxalobacteraceae bacterium CAVE-383]